jgi:small-conductance mechanosensitive channel
MWGVRCRHRRRHSRLHAFDAQYSLPEAIYEPLSKDGIEIPFQHIVVHNA